MTTPLLTYAQYLQSPWWRARKNAIIRYRGEQCERCKRRYALELHHRTYERLFRELPEDVELLCHWCHMRQHGILDPDHPGYEIDADIPLEGAA